MVKDNKDPSGKITINIGIELHKLLQKYLKNTGLKQNYFVTELISNALLETEKNIKNQQKTEKNINEWEKAKKVIDNNSNSLTEKLKKLTKGE